MLTMHAHAVFASYHQRHRDCITVATVSSLVRDTAHQWNRSRRSFGRDPAPSPPIPRFKGLVETHG
jgi:hypothetical protein